MKEPKRSATRGEGLMEGFLSRKRAERANKLIPKTRRKGRILDIGCGSFPSFLTGTVFSERYGLDRGIGEELKGQFLKDHKVILVDCDLEYGRHIPFENGFFDVVTMLAVLEHLSPGSLPAVISETKRVLKPGGVFIMTTPAPWTEGLLKFLALIKMVSNEEIEEHKGQYSKKQIYALLEEGGFEREKIEVGSFECLMNIWARAKKE